MSREHTIACYCYLGSHADPRNGAVHGPGWSEWELVRRAQPGFAGQHQPRVPLWGDAVESDPSAMARRIDAAADHGIDVMLYDWYRYDDGSFLDRALDEGSLGAPNMGSRIITLNAWTEWTAGGYLEPDAKHGMADLQVVRDVFGRED